MHVNIRISRVHSFLAKRGVKEEIQTFDARKINPEIRKSVEDLLRRNKDSFDPKVSYLQIQCFMCNGESIELIGQLAPLGNSVRMPSTSNILLRHYAAFINYIQHLLTYVNMPYSYNSWSLEDLGEELKK